MTGTEVIELLAETAELCRKQDQHGLDGRDHARLMGLVRKLAYDVLYKAKGLPAPLNTQAPIMSATALTWLTTNCDRSSQQTAARRIASFCDRYRSLLIEREKNA